jgi:hypothetical protein
MVDGDAVFQVFLGVLDVCFKCFIWVFQMLQWLYTHVLRAYVSSVSAVSDVRFMCVHLDVAEVYLNVA